MIAWLLIYGLSSFPMTAGLLQPTGPEFLSTAGSTIGDILRLTTKPWCSIVIVTDGTTSSLALRQVLLDMNTDFGSRLFEVRARKQLTLNNTFSSIVKQVAEWRRSYHCVIVMPVSSSYIFLEIFFEKFEFDLLLVWQQNPLVVTDVGFDLSEKLIRNYWRFFTTGGMVVNVQDEGKRWISAYTHSPFSPENGGQVIRIATWTPQGGLIIAEPSNLIPKESKRTHLSVKETMKDPVTLKKMQLYPETFRFQDPVEMKIAVEHWFPHVIIQRTSEDKKLVLDLAGSMGNLLQALAQSLNFTYQLIRPPDGEWGSKKADGSWSGMVGQVYRQDTDIALGPHDLTEIRATAIDYTTPIFTDARKFVVGQSRVEVDPWSFLLPLSPHVWIAVLLTLVLVILVTSAIGHNHRNDPPIVYISAVALHTFRLLLQQGLTMKLKRVSERMVVCGWLIGAMIILWSYSTNLMSLLAVRYAPRPIQTIQDLLDNDEMTVIFTPNTALSDYIENVGNGLLSELANLRHVGRYKDVHFTDFPEALESLVRKGDHVIATDTTDGMRLIANYFSSKGSCNFYLAREAFVPFVMGMIGQKGSPLVNVVGHRIGTIVAGGMYRHWLDSNFANSSSCRHMPSRYTVKEPLSLTNIWGMFVLLACGLSIASVTFLGEVLIRDSNSGGISSSHSKSDLY